MVNNILADIEANFLSAVCGEFGLRDEPTMFLQINKTSGSGVVYYSIALRFASGYVVRKVGQDLTNIFADIFDNLQENKNRLKS